MPEETETQTGSLQDFTFDSDEVDFFGVKSSGEESQEAVIKEVKEAATSTSSEEEDSNSEITETTSLEEKEKETKATAKVKEKEPTFFEDETVENETEEKGDKKKKEEKVKETEEDDEVFFTTLAEELKEKGILQNVEIPKDKKLSQEEFFTLQDEEIEARVNETFTGFFDELDEDGKAFLKFKKDGGRTADFLATYNTGLDLTDFDEKNEDQRAKVLNHYLTTVEGLEGEELKDRLAWIKEGGKEETYAKKWYKAIEDDSKAAREELAKAQEKISKKREQDITDFNEALNKVLLKTDDIGGITITKAEQKELGSFMTKPTVKVGKNKYVPALHAELSKTLRAATDEDKQTLILLAKLYKNKFDFTDIATKKKTEITKEVKSKLEAAKKGVKASSSGSNSKKSLGDFF
jgi:hypothetical protein